MHKTWTPGWYNGLLSVCGLAAALTCLPDHLHAQSLNEAVIEQLRTQTGVACSTLRGTDPLSSLGGELLTICSRTVSGGASPSAGSTGGGAATPTRLPSVVQQRLRNDNATVAKDSTATSTNTVINLSESLSLFGSLEYESLDRNVTTRQDGFDSSVLRLTGGIDNQFTEGFLAGVVLTFRNHTGDFTGGGDFQTDAIGLLGYASFNPVEQMFVQVFGGYTSENHARNRIATFNDTDTANLITVRGIANSDYDASEYNLGSLFGYDFHFSNLTVGPRAGINLLLQEFGNYSESGTTGLELQFDENNRTSLQSLIGVAGSVAISTGFGVVVPQASANWKHEFEDDARVITVSFVDDTRGKRFSYQNDGPDRNFFEFSVGSALVLPSQIQAFVNYRALVGHNFLDSHTGTIGVRVPL